MQGKATFKDHPIHPMLVPFPIAFWTGSLIADVLYFITPNAPSVAPLLGASFWSTMSTVLIGFGIVGALLAGVFGLLDYLTIPMKPKVKRHATTHLILNVGITALYAINLYLRYQTPETTIGYALSVIAIVALVYSGWLGGDMAYEHRVGVKEEHKEEEPEQRGHPGLTETHRRAG